MKRCDGSVLRVRNVASFTQVVIQARPEGSGGRRAVHTEHLRDLLQVRAPSSGSLGDAVR